MRPTNNWIVFLNSIMYKASESSYRCDQSAIRLDTVHYHKQGQRPYPECNEGFVCDNHFYHYYNYFKNISK